MPAIETVWNAWEEELCRLPLPDGWNVTDYSLATEGELAQGRIRRVVAEALAREPVRSRLRSARSACILVDDLTRPVCWAEVLGVLRQELAAAGVPEHRTRILVSLAGHAQLKPEELRWKLGEAAAEVAAQYAPDGPFQWLVVHGKKVGLSQLYCEADLKIALGSPVPHPFAGFSGGGKAVMPGIADLEAVRRNHFLVNFGRGKVGEADNQIRREMDDVAEASGLDLVINATCNARRRIVHLTAGPPRDSYAAAVAFARSYWAAEVKRPHNVIVLNAYPKDRELLQVGNAFNVIRTLPPRARATVEVVVLLARLRNGLGHHALFGPGGSLYRPPTPLSFLRGLDLVVYAPELGDDLFRQVFAPGYALCRQWDDVVRELLSRGWRHYDLGVFHQAAMQTAR